MREIITSTVVPVTNHKPTVKSAAVKAVKATAGVASDSKHPPMRLDTSAISTERRIKLRGYPAI